MNEPVTAAPWDSAQYLRAILRAPVYEAAEHTPLQEMPALSARLGSTVEVKREDLQAVHSFKIPYAPGDRAAGASASTP